MTASSVSKAMRSHGICVIIPTYNNAGTLAHVLTDVLEYAPDVIVVNDGSTDNTAEVLCEFRDRADIVSYPRNRGKGYALKTGLSHARQRGFDYAMTIDSDGQHRASDIPKMVQAVIEHPGALVVGARDLTRVDINGKSSFANKFSNFWFRVQTGRNLTDTQTGYRVYPLKHLHGLRMLTYRYEAELELLVFAAWNGVRIVSVPIDVYYPPRSERVSHFKPALDFTRISILNTILCVAAIVYGIPVRTWYYFRQKRAFGREWKFFTRKEGERKPAAMTLRRLFRSLYALSFYLVSCLGVLTPLGIALFKFARPNEKKRTRYHRKLQDVARYIGNHLPAASPVTYINDKEDFRKPALIVCNHQSHLDLPVIMALYPKIVFLTNDWVWNNSVFGDMIRYAEYYPVSAGIDNLLPKLRDLRDRGYSIMVFPEGTRSADCSIARFHQGAFHLARELELDVLPLVLHGAGHVLPKLDFMLRKGEISIEVLDRIPYDPESPLTMLKQASRARATIREAYNKTARRKENTEYFIPLVLYKYAWRGWKTVSECKRALRQADNYSMAIDHLPASCRSVAIHNAGIGVVPLLFAMVHPDVQVTAYIESLEQYDVAVNTPHIPDNLHFIHTVWPEDAQSEADISFLLTDEGLLQPL